MSGEGGTGGRPSVHRVGASPSAAEPQGPGQGQLVALEQGRLKGQGQ